MQAQGGAKKDNAYQCVYHGGDARQGFGGKFNHSGQAAAAGILGEIDCRADAKGKNDEEGKDNYIQGVEYAGEDTGGTLQDALGTG